VPSHVHYDAAAVPRPKWTTLALLDLTGVQGVWEGDVGTMVAACGDLTEIRLGGCQNVTDALIPALAQSSRALRHLRLPGIPALTDAGIRAIGVCFPDLRTLDVSGCKGFGPAALLSLASACPDLEELRMGDTSATIDAASLLGIAASCRHLRVLEAGNSAPGGGWGCYPRGLPCPHSPWAAQRVPPPVARMRLPPGRSRAPSLGTAPSCPLSPPPVTAALGGTCGSWCPALAWPAPTWSSWMWQGGG
jgi:hypothetical protein